MRRLRPKEKPEQRNLRKEGDRVIGCAKESSGLEDMTALYSAAQTEEVLLKYHKAAMKAVNGGMEEVQKQPYAGHAARYTR